MSPKYFYKIAEPDPAQKHLRALKKSWNAEVKTLIAELIAVKRGINGTGDANFNIPPSSIKHPLPSELGAYLNDLAGRYQSIISSAGEIINVQEQYSRTRRKSRAELEQATGLTPTAELEAEINKIAAGNLSRTWTHLKQYPLAFVTRDTQTKYRLKLLRAMSDYEKIANEIELELTGNDRHAVYTAFFKYKYLLKLINFNLLQPLEEIVKSENGESPETPTGKSPAKETKEKPINNSLEKQKEEVLKIKTDNLLIGMFIETLSKKENNVKGVEDILLTYSKEVDKLSIAALSSLEKAQEDSKLLAASMDALKQEYSNMVDFAANAINAKGSSIQELLTSIKEAKVNVPLLKVAKYSLRRWIGRAKMKLLDSEENRTRLEIAELLSRISAEMNEVQDLLQNSNSTLEGIKNRLPSLYALLAEGAGLFDKLGVKYQDQYSLSRVEEDIYGKKKEKEVPLKNISKSELLDMSKLKQIFETAAGVSEEPEQNPTDV